MSQTLFAVFARALGFLARAPGLSRLNVPPAVRAIFAFALALGVASTLQPVHVRDAADFAVLIGSETLVGMVLGIGATLAAEAVSTAGRMLDDLVGLRASVPGVAVAPAGFGGLMSLTYVAAFFATGGIDVLVVAFAHSFAVVPVGSALEAVTLERVGIGFGVAFARLCLELAAPAICVTLCIHIGLAALARAVPRFGHLAVAFPAAYAAVLLVSFLSLAGIRELAAAR